MARRSSRRNFLKTSTLAGAGVWVAARPTFAQSKSPNEKLNLAAIGGGGKGHSDIEEMHRWGCNVLAICDVDDDSASAAFKRFPEAKRFRDFREMLEKLDKQIDVVTISTPDHTHAVATMMAMKMGKHVYTQKPLCHDVYEARALTEAAEKYKVVTQMGNQGSAEPGLREAIEVVQSGVLGAIREVHVWTNRPVWPQGGSALLRLRNVHNALLGSEKENEKIVPPDTLDWDLWLGTAPYRPYSDSIEPKDKRGYLTFHWRGWLDYGTGALGDMACHTANMAFRACKLGYPTSVEAEMSEWNGQTYPTWSVIRYEFPEREGLPPLKWTWYDGGSDKPAWVNKKLKELAHGHDIPGSGSLIIGDKGTLFSPNDYGAAYILLPEKNFEGFKPPAPTLPRAPENNNYKEWVDACKANKPEMCFSSFKFAGPLTETVVLGCVAMRAGKKIEWDGPNMKITNMPEANSLLRREYRKGWEL
jgi:predicted dehydrogenase